MTIKEKILTTVKAENDWIFGGRLERLVGEAMGCKDSNVSRRCRELVKEGKLERKLVRVDSVSVVKYRLSETFSEQVTETSRPTLSEPKTGKEMRSLRKTSASGSPLSPEVSQLPLAL